jgi:mono/diheme cytochrome c family protein
MNRAKKWAYPVAGLLLALGILFFPRAARSAQEGGSKQDQNQKTVHLIPSLEGSDLFHSYCASCHGADGKGDGPAAKALTAKVADLTTISKRNGGVFPAKRVERTIAGDDAILAHGSREMPIWGPIFHQVEQDRDLGHIRLRNVTQYIETIQQK